MKVLVTGCAGFIGSHLCERLIADGHDVLGIDSLVGGRLSNLDAIIKHPKFHFRQDDVWCIARWPIEADWVFHLAAVADVVPSIEQPIYYHNANVTGTIHVLETARRIGAKRFIYAASSSCYGIPDEYPTKETAEIRPMYPYALTKYLGEQYVMHWAKVYGLPAVSLRLFNVYGPRSRTSGSYGAVFGVWLAQLANQKPITIVGDGEQSRDFTYVTDVVDAFVKAAESDATGIMNVGSDGHYSVNRLVKLLCGCLTGEGYVQHIPDRPGEPRITFADTRVIKWKLGWQSKVSFEEGVAIMKGLIPQYKDAPLWTKDKIADATEAWFKVMK